MIFLESVLTRVEETILIEMFVKLIKDNFLKYF